MMIDVVVRGVDEIILLCSLHEVMISDEVMISYVTSIIQFAKVKRNNKIL